MWAEAEGIDNAAGDATQATANSPLPSTPVRDVVSTLAAWWDVVVRVLLYCKLGQEMKVSAMPSHEKFQRCGNDWSDRKHVSYSPLQRVFIRVD